MLRKCLCDGNDDDDDDGDNGDENGDVKISFYLIFKGIMTGIEVTRFHECFRKGFLLQVIMWKVTN